MRKNKGAYALCIVSFIALQETHSLADVLEQRTDFATSSRPTPPRHRARKCA